MQASVTPNPDHQIAPSSAVRPTFGRRGSTQAATKATTIACAPCRRKKIKCDSLQPYCSQCQADGQQCKYVEWKKTGLPRGYVRSLEAQIREKRSPRVNSSTDFSAEALRAENDQLRGRGGSTQEPLLQHGLPSDDILPFSVRSSPYAPSDHDILLQDPFDVAKIAISDLLTAEDQYKLCTLYFARCHPFVPILHKPTFSTDKHIHLSLSVFALASRHDALLTSKSDIFYSLAKQTAQATFNCPDMSTLAALILQAIYEIGMPNSSVQALTTVGSALALASAFKLLRLEEQAECTGKPNRWMERPVDWIEEEGRRRAFLMVLSLSRWMATIQEREMGFPVKREIAVMLPISDEIWFADQASRSNARPITSPITALDTASDAGPFARFVQALGLFAQVNDFNQSYRMRTSSENAEDLSKIDSVIQQYLGSFPDDWRNPQLEGEGLLDPTTLALAHREPHGFSKSRCSASAEEILDVAYAIQDLPNAGNFLFPHPLVLAARVRLLELVQRKGNYRGRDMDLVVKALMTFGKFWGMQEKLTEHAQKIQANNVPFGEPLTEVIPVTKHPVPRPKLAQLIPGMQSRFLGSMTGATLKSAVVLSGNPTGSLQGVADANGSPGDSRHFLSMTDETLFSNDDIFEWAVGLGPESLDAQSHGVFG